jgi:hypothetical protein
MPREAFFRPPRGRDTQPIPECSAGYNPTKFCCDHWRRPTRLIPGRGFLLFRPGAPVLGQIAHSGCLSMKSCTSLVR